MFSIFNCLRHYSMGSFEYLQIDESTNYSFKSDFCKQESFMEGFRYRTGFIFYIDVLGCRGLSLKSNEDEESLTKVKKIVEIFQEIEKQYGDKHWGKNYKMPFTYERHTVDKSLAEVNIEVTMSLFSDSIIISYYPEIADRFVIWYEQMHQIFNDICRTIYLFACNGFSLRGGMSYGQFYHFGNVCYGPALLEAVRLESEICYPAIAICDSFRERILGDKSSKEIDDYCFGYKHPYELKTFANDFFSIFLDSTIVNEQPKMMLDWLTAIFYYNLDGIDMMKKVITEEMNTNYPENVKEKYIWLAKQFNHSLRAADALGISNHSHTEIQI